MNLTVLSYKEEKHKKAKKCSLARSAVVPQEVFCMRLKCAKFIFGCGSAPDPVGELTMLP